MLVAMKKEKDISDLSKIVNLLLLNAGFSSVLGLFHGKMGVVLFFANYSRFTKDLLYDDFCGELLDEVCLDMHDNMPIDFENGFCGIAWGIDYLLKNQFLEGDSNDILAEIDQKIMERDPLRITDFSFKTGLMGILYYVLCRYSNNESIQTLDREYLSRLYVATQKVICSGNVEFPFSIDIHIIDNILKYNSKNVFEPSIPNLFYGDSSVDINDVKNLSIGLEDGLSGIGIQLVI